MTSPFDDLKAKVTTTEGRKFTDAYRAAAEQAKEDYEDAAQARRELGRKLKELTEKTDD